MKNFYEKNEKKKNIVMFFMKKKINKNRTILKNRNGFFS